MVRHNIDSRIIIDCEAHNRFLPNDAVHFGAIPTSKRGKSLSERSSDAGVLEAFDFDDFPKDNMPILTLNSDNMSSGAEIYHRP